jgi:hypothetical protein
MSNERNQQLIEDFDREKGARANWDEHWEEVAKFTIPRKDDVWNRLSKTTGERKGERVFDASPSHYAELHSAALSTMLTNPTSTWMEFTTGDPELDKIPEVTKYLQQLVRSILSIFNQTNFYPEMNEAYLDLSTFGTAALRVMEDDELTVRFEARPIYEYWICEDNKGETDVSYTSRMLTGRQLRQEFKETVFTESLMAAFMKDPSKKYEVVEVIQPKADFKGEVGTKPFQSVKILREEMLTLSEKGFNEFPIMFPRWSKISGEKYGRSPAMKALPDIKMINKMMKDTLRAAQKKTDPPLMLPDDNVLGSVNSMPGGLNFYRAGTQDRIFGLDTGSNPGIGFETMKDVRERIKQAFFIDQLQLIQSDRMTATEANIRTDENLRLLGPTLARQHFEFLQPLIARVLSIMKRKNKLPEGIPSQLEKINLQVFYTSQIAKAQRMSEGQNFQRFFEAVAPVMQIQPNVVDNIDGDKAVKFNARLYGVPEEIFRSTAERKEVRDNRAKQEQAAAERQAKIEEAEAVSKVGPVAIEAAKG